MKVIPPSLVEGGSGITQVEALDERQEAAYRVLDQLQRTFCFLKLSYPSDGSSIPCSSSRLVGRSTSASMCTIRTTPLSSLTSCWIASRR